MKEAARLLMDMPVSFRSVKEGMKDMGIAEDDLSFQMAVIVSMYKEAMAGNVRAAEFLRDTLGDSAEAENRKRRLEIDIERFELEKKRFEIEQKEKAETGDGMPVIINVRPDRAN